MTACVVVVEKILTAHCNVDLQDKVGCSVFSLGYRKWGMSPSRNSSFLHGATCNVDLRIFINGVTSLQLAEGHGHTGVATMIRNIK